MAENRNRESENVLAEAQCKYPEFIPCESIVKDEIIPHSRMHTHNMNLFIQNIFGGKFNCAVALNLFFIEI